MVKSPPFVHTSASTIANVNAIKTSECHLRLEFRYNHNWNLMLNNYSSFYDYLFLLN